MNRRAALLAVLLLGGGAGGTTPALAALPSAAELLAASIAYHDPEGRWGRGAFGLVLAESRPDGTTRHTWLELNQRQGVFVLRRPRPGGEVTGRLAPGQCAWSLAGELRVGPGEGAVDPAELTCERLQRWRDYYGYLWGLPMKLEDRGTRLGEVSESSFQGRPVLALRVTYDPEVGRDTWDFFFDPASRALVGYRFFHDPAAGDGEYIVLDGESEGAGLRLPRRRTWYTNEGDELLGTDELVEPPAALGAAAP